MKNRSKEWFKQKVELERGESITAGPVENTASEPVDREPLFTYLGFGGILASLVMALISAFTSFNLVILVVSNVTACLGLHFVIQWRKCREAKRLQIKLKEFEATIVAERERLKNE